MRSKRTPFVGLAILALAAGAWSVSAQQPDPLPALEAKINRLQAHLQGIESVRAIKRLQYAYGHYVELGLWNDFADLFADDAVTNYQQGVHGRAEVQQLFFKQVGQGKLGLAEGRIYPHILFQPVITLAPDGRTAKGRWRILAMLGGLGGSATWYSGVYENEYAFQDGAWKIVNLHSEPKATAAYTASGWKDSGVRLPAHYSNESVANPIPSVASPAPAGRPSLGSLADRVNQLTSRSALLNDQAEVTNLQDNYGYAIDGKRWDQAAGLFTDDGTLELGLQGIYAGKASIRRAFGQLAPQLSGDHVYLQTLVSVASDRRTAKARGVELIFADSGGGELQEGVFENSFVKQGNIWKIQSVHFYPRMIVDAATGWAKSAKPAPGPSKELPPDRPPTSLYEIYPKFSVAPFHFDNPVTGKPPQYPEGVSSARLATVVQAPVRAPAIRNAAQLDARLAEVETSIARAEAYDIAENLIGAHGYSLDDSPFAQVGTNFVTQILQPVIEVAPDGKSARVRARTLSLGGTSGAAGYWTAGTYEDQIQFTQGSWHLQSTRSTTVWSGPYPGGWASRTDNR
jgi:hypothetical protein